MGRVEEQLPNKTPQQILKKASKLGMKREFELLNLFYDHENKAWNEEYRHYREDNVVTITQVIPAPQSMTSEEAKNRLGEHISKKFFEIAVKDSYLEMLSKVGIDHNDELFKFYCDLRFDAFLERKMENYDERLEAVKESIKKQISEQKTTKQ